MTTKETDLIERLRTALEFLLLNLKHQRSTETQTEIVRILNMIYKYEHHL